MSWGGIKQHKQQQQREVSLDDRIMFWTQIFKGDETELKWV